MYHMKLDSFCEVSLSSTAAEMPKREASDACTSSLIYGLPPSPCATRRLGAFIHNAVDIRIRGQGDPYNHHTSSKSRGYCASRF